MTSIAKYQAQLSVVVSQEQYDEIAAIAAIRKISKGDVTRQLIHLGLIEFYNQGGLPNDRDK